MLNDPNETEGCSSCGVSKAVASDLWSLPSLSLKRTHRYREAVHPASFGPGVFCQWDCYVSVNSNNIALFDPNASGNTGWLEISPANGDHTVDGVYWDEYHAQGREMRLFDVNGQPTADKQAAVTVVLNRLDGSKATFEIIDIEPGNPWGGRPARLVRWEDRAGNAIVFAFQFPRTASDAELGFDREKLWHRTTITDAYGKVMTFHYGKPAYRWVVTAIDVPNGTTIFYDYTGVDLSAVRYPDGSRSTFTTEVDATQQTLNKIFEEAGATGIHRRKTAYLTQSTWVDPVTAVVTNQVPGLIRRLDNGAGEIAYFNQEDPANLDIRYLYNGGNELLRHVDQNGPDNEVSDEVSTTFVLGQPIPTTGWQLIAAYQNDPAKGRLIPTTWTDILGRATTYTFDLGTGARLGTQYPDGSSDSATYNAFNQPLHEVDRLGRVTDTTYDATGHRLTRTVAVGTPAEATWRWTYNARGQVTKAMDALFDPAFPTLHVTDYTYDADGFLIAITTPADESGGPRFTRTFTYDSAGRLRTGTDEANRTVAYDYDARNRVIRITYPDSSIETFTYALTGPDVNLLTRRTDRNGNTTAFTYDAAGRRTGEAIKGPGVADPVIGTRSWTYLTGTELTLSMTDNGDLTTYGYDYRNRQVSAGRQASTTTTLVSITTYDDAQRIASTTDPYGRKQHLVYDLNDRVVRTVQELIPGGVPGGANLSTLARIPTANPPYVIEDAAYDAEGQLLSRTDGRGFVTGYQYDAQGRTTAATEAQGTAIAATTAYQYDDQGNRTLMINPRGFATQTTYTGRNLAQSTTEAAGTAVAATRSWTWGAPPPEGAPTHHPGPPPPPARGGGGAPPRSWTWSPTGMKATETDFRGNTTSFTYGVCCDRLVRTTDPTGAFISIAYDAYGNITAQTDANGLTSTMTYDARHREATRSNGAGEVTSFTYDDNLTDGAGLDVSYASQLVGLGLGAGSDGSAIRITDPLGHAEAQIRDGLERGVRSVDGNGNAATVDYDAVVSSLVETAVTDALGHTLRSRADGAERIRIMVDAEHQLTQSGYDANGNRVSQRDPNNVGQDCVFDARNRETSCTDTAGATTAKSYDANGNVVSQTDALGHITTMVFDARDRKTTSTDRIGGVTALVYDANRNLLSITDAQGAVTSYVYDPRNLLNEETFPLGQAGVPDVRSYTYDPGRRLQTRTDQAGVLTTYVYDGANRLTARTYPDGLNDGFVYDDASRMTSASSDRYATTVTRAYDAGDRLTSETQTVVGQAYTVAYGYDADNLTTQVTYPDGKQVTRAYTQRHQLASVAYDGASVATRGYDPGMRLISTTSGNGRLETRTYNADNTVAGIAVPGATNFTYAYDANKRKTSEGHQLAVEAQAFGYDFENRVTTWQRDGQETQNWTLTTVGDWAATTRTGANAFSQTRTHSSVHEITSITQNGITMPLLHDAKGNLIQDQAGQQYAWDPENRLLAAVVGAATNGYRYDALGRRLAKIAGGTITTFVQDGPQVIAEYAAPLLQSQAIGAPALAGSLSDDGQGTVTVAAGGTDIGGTADQFRYAYATLTGDGSITTRVTTQSATDGLAKAGLMLRESLAPDARNAAVFITPGNGAIFQRRLTPAGATTSTATGAGTASVPQWLRLVRVGSLITAFRSSDGSTWTTIGSDTVPFAVGASIHIGLAVTSHHAGALGTATFTNLAMNGDLAPATIPAVARVYVYGSYVDDVLGYVTQGALGQRHYVHSNHVYSPAAITDSAGTVSERYAYDAYGRQAISAGDGTPRTSSAIGYDRGFTGYISDAETGLLHARARQYAPVLGRFASRDPKGYRDGASLYGAYFVPSQTDPEGTIGVWTVVFFVGRLALGAALSHDIAVTDKDLPDPFINQVEPVNEFTWEGTPGGECEDKRTCPEGQKRFTFYQQRWTNGFTSIGLNSGDSVKLEAWWQWKSGKMSGRTIATGNTSMGRVAWHVKKITANKYPKTYKCECITDIPCASVTVSMRQFIDYPWPAANDFRDVEGSFHVCADGTGGPGAGGGG